MPSKMAVKVAMLYGHSLRYKVAAILVFPKFAVYFKLNCSMDEAFFFDLC